VKQKGTTNWTSVSYYAAGKSRSNANAQFSPWSASLEDSGSMYSNYNPGPPYETGDNWLLSKAEYKVSPFQAVRETNQAATLFVGPVYGLVQSATLPPFSNATAASMAADGTKAIALVEPTKAQVDLAVSFAELYREGFPALIGSGLYKDRAHAARKLHRSGSGEYLNYQFGWTPMISDIKSFCKVVMGFHKNLELYSRQQSELIHRQFRFKGLEDVVTSFSGTAIPRPASFNVNGVGTAQVTVHQEKWFEGAFRFYIPMGNSQRDRMRRYNALARKFFGARVDPEVLWNLSPWSWAVDWFIDTGDIIHNVSALGKDGLVMQYGFQMDTRVLTERHLANFSWDVYTPQNVKEKRGNSSYVYKRTYKNRIRATPYGFGLTDGDLNTRQKAIIAALGLQAGGSKVR